MPLLDTHQIISVDDHLIEHPRVWVDRLGSRDVEAGPQVVTLDDGRQVWRFEGQFHPQIGLNAVAGKRPEDYGLEPLRFDDMIAGCYDPHERVKDMDLDGVQASMCFPSLPGFAGGLFHRAKDKDLALKCVRAWNDFHIDEWCATAPDRFIPLGILPTWDVALAVAEARRLADKGCRTISFPDSPVPLGMPSFFTDAWDGLWEVVAAEQIPISLHFGGAGFVPGFSFSNEHNPHQMHTEAPFVVAVTLFASNQMWTAVDLLFCGKLQQFPGLRFSLAEGGVGWIPYLIERADYAWDRHRWYQDIDKNVSPSELFRQHFYGCFIEDDFGVRNRDIIGVQRLLVEVDYPHSDSNWPNSRKRIAESMREVPDEEVGAIVEDNARELFRFPRC